MIRLLVVITPYLSQITFCPTREFPAPLLWPGPARPGKCPSSVCRRRRSQDHGSRYRQRQWRIPPASYQHVRLRCECEMRGPPTTAPTTPPTTAPGGPATTAPVPAPIAAPVSVRSATA